jgi:outer membrane protein OmpA-like peptidoglycan-associated protein
MQSKHLKSGAIQALRLLGIPINETPQKQITIKRLSEKRAKAVSDYLARNGIDAKRLTAKGYGFDYPVAENDPKEGNKANRRVELIRQK